MIRQKEHRQKNKNMRKQRVKRIASLFFLLAAILAACFLHCQYREDKRQEDRFEELEETEIGFGKKKPESRNPDWIGWLKIKGTSISYPVMQREGDAEYYLHRDFDGAYSFYGTPFLDIRCTLESDNCIIYGHNINGGRVFGALHAYADKNYYKEHPEIQLRAGEEKRKYGIVSVIQTDTASPVYSFADTGNHEEYGEYVQKILSGSLYQTELAEQIGKEMETETEEKFFRQYQFLTLSTCRTLAGRDQRLLVVAAKKREETQEKRYLLEEKASLPSQ